MFDLMQYKLGYTTALCCLAVVVLALLLSFSAVQAQSVTTGTSTSPVVENSTPPAIDIAHVFAWNAVPVNKQIPITLARFDARGYLLTDTAGETIAIPFQKGNLAVLEFTFSTVGSVYFENSGVAPVLYIPLTGYLENATVDGARWYPFGDMQAAQSPAYLSLASDVSEYQSVNWYPNMQIRGSYRVEPDGGSASEFAPIEVSVDGSTFSSPTDFDNFVKSNPGAVAIGTVDLNVYKVAESSSSNGSSQFMGTEARKEAALSAAVQRTPLPEGITFHGSIVKYVYPFQIPAVPSQSFIGDPPPGFDTFDDFGVADDYGLYDGYPSYGGGYSGASYDSFSGGRVFGSAGHVHPHRRR